MKPIQATLRRREVVAIKTTYWSELQPFELHNRKLMRQRQRSASRARLVTLGFGLVLLAMFAMQFVSTLAGGILVGGLMAVMALLLFALSVKSMLTINAQHRLEMMWQVFTGAKRKPERIHHVEREVEVPVSIFVDQGGAAPEVAWNYQWEKAKILSEAPTTSTTLTPRPFNGNVSLADGAFALSASRSTDGQAHLVLQDRQDADRLVLQVPDHLLGPRARNLDEIDRLALQVPQDELRVLLGHVKLAAELSGVDLPVQIESAAQVHHA